MANNKAIEKIETPKGLKVLCIMSFIGFALAMAVDTSNYLSYSSIDEVMKSPEGFEAMKDRLDLYEANGMDISEGGTMRIALMYVYRSIIDVLALLGVSMMFIRLKLGFVIYAIFQIAYAAIPFVMFGGGGSLIVGNASIAITLIYVGLFLTQKRHLIR